MLLLDINTTIRVVLTVLQKLRTFAQASCIGGRGGGSVSTSAFFRIRNAYTSRSYVEKRAVLADM